MVQVERRRQRRLWRDGSPRACMIAEARALGSMVSRNEHIYPGTLEGSGVFLRALAVSSRLLVCVTLSFETPGRA